MNFFFLLDLIWAFNPSLFWLAGFGFSFLLDLVFLYRWIFWINASNFVLKMLKYLSIFTKLIITLKIQSIISYIVFISIWGAGGGLYLPVCLILSKKKIHTPLKLHLKPWFRIYKQSNKCNCLHLFTVLAGECMAQSCDLTGFKSSHQKVSGCLNLDVIN